MEKDSCLDDLKKAYALIQKKYNLPSFDELNRDFSVEKIADAETDFLVREIRRYVAEKLSNYLRNVEALLNPVNVPMFVFSFVKTMKEEEHKKLRAIYEKLSKNEIEAIEQELDFSEEKEADFLKSSFELWKEVKVELLGIVRVIKKNWGNKFEEKGKSYFG